jgi:hypothetical protein
MKGLLLKKAAQTVLQNVFIFLEFRYTILLKGDVKDKVKI